MFVKLIAPNGKEIIGIAETIIGTAQVSGFEVDVKGKLEPEYSGWTEIHWDGQTTEYRDGQMVLVCELGEEWLENSCQRIETDAPTEKRGLSWTDVVPSEAELAVLARRVIRGDAIAKAPAMYQLLRSIREAWPQIGTDEEINGGDCVEWLGEIYPAIDKLMQEILELGERKPQLPAGGHD